jgi:hypothetical protein
MCVSSLIKYLRPEKEKFCSELHARCSLRFIIRLQEDAWIFPTRALEWATDPRNYWNPSESFTRGTDNSWPWAPMKKLFSVSQLEEARIVHRQFKTPRAEIFRSILVPRSTWLSYTRIDSIKANPNYWCQEIRKLLGHQEIRESAR